MRFIIHDWMLGNASKGSIPSSLRRRVTPMGQRALQASWGLTDLAHARFVLSSRHGEFDRTLSLLQSLVAREEPSPADFSLSVHHALIGLLSITVQNRQGHIAVAAGSESFCFGLLESVACLQENPHQPVILIHMDDALPDLYAPFVENREGPIACAFALGAANETFALSIKCEPTARQPSASSHVADFISFLEGSDTEKISLGENHDWRWTRHV